MAVGKGVTWDFALPNNPCSDFAPYSDDPLGLWLLSYQEFPGRGTDYPVLPGHTVVLATDAINHGAFYPAGLDLSRADFESAGVSDADNPAVPNTIDTGYDGGLGGHGLFFGALGSVAFVSLPLDEATLITTRYLGTSSSLYPRVPRERLLDVIALRSEYTGGFAECTAIISSLLDREPFRGRGTDEEVEFRHSVERRASPVRIQGRTILQRTRTSRADFIRGDRTPGATVTP